MTAGIILLMVVVSGLIRYVHDSRSSHAATALATMVSTTATVRRVGAGERQIPSEELVVGDIVTLSVGDIVPADCKLLESRDLRIAQGALTGESCFASMFVRQVRQCFSVVWADGFPRCRHRFPVM